MRKIAAVAMLIGLLVVCGCSKSDGSVESSPTEPAKAEPAAPAESAVPPEDGPTPSPEDLARMPSATREITVTPKVPKPDFDNPPDKPTDRWILWFVSQVQDAYQRKDAHYLLEHMAKDVKITFTNGDQTKTFTRDQWFTQTQTSLSFAKEYEFWITQFVKHVDGDKVFLELYTLEQYQQPGGKTVRGETYVTMDLEWTGTDFRILTMKGETTGAPVDY